jgi:hypothetical protein
MTVQTILSRKGRNVVTIEPTATLQAAIATFVHGTKPTCRDVRCMVAIKGKRTSSQS